MALLKSSPYTSLSNSLSHRFKLEYAKINADEILSLTNLRAVVSHDSSLLTDRQVTLKTRLARLESLESQVLEIRSLLQREQEVSHLLRRENDRLKQDGFQIETLRSQLRESERNSYSKNSGEKKKRKIP